MWKKHKKCSNFNTRVLEHLKFYYLVLLGCLDEQIIDKSKYEVVVISKIHILIIYTLL